VLVGTISIEKSELLSRMLKRKGIPHHVLNAKHHEREAEIVAQAGRKRAVTISTNMAGRGTDIVLGGNPEMIAKTMAKGDEEKYLEILEEARVTCAKEREEVIAAGGLHILGTERHEARRIDNQLRGRAGRQGDPGSSRFYLSLEDDLLRIFGAERIAGWMDRLGIEEGEPIEHRWISKTVENAQKRVEAQNFEIRKHLLEYDDVMNQQRTIVYSKRRQILEGKNLREEIETMISDLVDGIVVMNVDEKSRPQDWDISAIEEAFLVQFGFRAGIDVSNNGFRNSEDLAEFLKEKALSAFRAKEQEFGEELMKRIETDIMLATMDQLWKDHLLNMDHLKEGIGLRGYGQQDPLIVYKREAYEMFESMWATLQENVVGRLMRIQLVSEEPPERLLRRRKPQRMMLGRGDSPQKPATVRRDGPKVGRNDPCPCGSGKKYKKCCGA
jgi:preprotein translocase subunit SecA